MLVFTIGFIGLWIMFWFFMKENVIIDGYNWDHHCSLLKHILFGIFLYLFVYGIILL